MFLFVILYRCIPDPLLCHVGNWKYSHILLGAGNWSATEERCHWCMEPSVTVPRQYWHQQCCRVFQRRSVLQYHHRLVSLLLRPGVRIEIITIVNMKITVHWDVTLCGLLLTYLCFGGKCYFVLPNLKVGYLCAYDCFQTQFKLTKIIDIIKPLWLKTHLHKV